MRFLFIMALGIESRVYIEIHGRFSARGGLQPFPYTLTKLKINGNSLALDIYCPDRHISYCMTIAATENL